MAGNPLAIKMIESTIDKAIRDIKDNPQDGLKSLVNLTNHFASSDFKGDLIKSLQTMLMDPNSSYYNIIPSLVKDVNHNTIKTFIINVAYNSWSYGGKRIKQYKKIYNYNIPWTIIFDFTQTSDNNLNNDTITSIIRQGKKIGIYTYMFFIDSMDSFSDILRRNLDCAFILYVSPAILTVKNICEVKSYHNIFFSVLYQPTMSMKIFKDATKLLYEHQCLFGSYGYYSDENIEHILNNRWIDDIVTTGSPFGVLIESQNCSQANASLTHDYIYNSKINQEHPALLIDLYEDITKIDNLLSKKSCIFKILSNGDISCNCGNTLEKFNINNITLLEILSKLS